MLTAVSLKSYEGKVELGLFIVSDSKKQNLGFWASDGKIVFERHDKKFCTDESYSLSGSLQVLKSL